MAPSVNSLDIVLCSIILLITLRLIACSPSPSSEALPKFNVTQFVTDLGYPVETHANLKTEDGYLLTMYRIPHGRNNTADPKKVPVLLMHGLGGTGFDWVSGGPNASYAFLLADQGYDVWLGNTRGTPYSRMHERYDPDQNPDKFWDFSWHEIGYYDLYTKINYMLNTTHQSQVFYIGHSQGTTGYFVLMSTRPEMNEKVKLMVALAPSVYVPRNLAILPEGFALNTFHQIDAFRRLLGIHTSSEEFKELVCYSQVAIQPICDIYSGLSLLLYGVDPSRTSREHYELFAKSFPNMASVKQFLHYFQVSITGEFRQYHLGNDENLQKYGSELPPKYNLSRTSSPVALLVGDRDTTATLEGAQRLAAELPNVVEIHIVINTNHLDFITADDTVMLVFAEITSLFYNYGR